MHALIGLGNPDAKYAKNRHNVGFMFVDWLLASVKREEIRDKIFQYDKYVRAEIAKIQLLTLNSKLSTILAKPQTYMNNSGETARKMISDFDIRISDLFVVHDDLDMRIGNFKVQMGVGPKKHNGIDSVEQHLKTDEFWRIRIGVDNRVQGTGMRGEAYVLSNFTKEELGQVTSLFPQILERLEMVIREVE